MRARALPLRVWRAGHAPSIGVNVVEDRVQVGGRGIEAKLLQPFPELGARDGPIPIRVHALEDVHQTPRHAPDRIAQHLEHVLFVVDGARAVGVKLAEDAVAHRLARVEAEEQPGVKVTYKGKVLDITAADEVGDH